MIKEPEIIYRLQGIVKELLESTGFVKVTDLKSEAQSTQLFGQRFEPDLIFEVQVRGKNKYLLVFEIKSMGQPRYVRSAANQLLSIVGTRREFYGVFGASFISEESRQICREQGIGFADLAGNCLFKFDNVYISIEGRPNPYPATRPLKSIFAPKSTRALRVLLCDPKKEWFVKDLARDANISLGQASNLKKRLLEYEFIEAMGDKKGMKFRLSDPKTLLSKWASNYTYRSNRITNLYCLDDVKTIENKLVDYCEAKQIPYAFTLTSGASRVAPFLRYRRVFAYVMDSSEKIAQELGWKEVPSGPNISLLEPYDEGVFYGLQNINGAKVVCDIQLYLDLQGYRERGEEAARFLFESRLTTRW